MFISLRNLLGLRYGATGEREKEREAKNGEKRTEEGILGLRGGVWDSICSSTRIPRESLVVFGTSLRNVRAVFAD